METLDSAEILDSPRTEALDSAQILQADLDH